jgi:N-acetylmuramoyl-L-alanine amidase
MAQIHTVAPGDCLYSIADTYGFRNWKTIQDAPENADMKKARPDPNVLYEGDQVFIPDPEDAKKNVACPSEDHHKFKVKLPKILFRVCVKDEEDEPISGKKFRILDGDEKLDGTTDGDGIVEHKIRAQARSVRLFVFFSGDEEKGEHLMWDVGVGTLDPSDSPEGIQERLNNLGFVCGEPDGEWHPGMTAAVKTFQKSAKIDTSGKMDDATAAKLKEVHGKI